MLAPGYLHRQAMCIALQASLRSSLFTSIGFFTLHSSLFTYLGFIFVYRPMLGKVLAQHLIKNGDASRTACLRNRITIILSKLEE